MQRQTTKIKRGEHQSAKALLSGRIKYYDLEECDMDVEEAGEY